MKRMVVFGSNQTGWYERHPDDSVTRIVLRRTDDPGRMYEEHRFSGATIDEADAAYETWLAERAEIVARHAGRRARWGPAELQDSGIDRVGECLRACAQTRERHPALVRWVESGAPPVRSDAEHRALFGEPYEKKPRRVA